MSALVARVAGPRRPRSIRTWSESAANLGWTLVVLVLAGTRIGQRARDATDLDVYNIAMQLSADVWRLVMRWPNFARWTIGKQLVRSAGSVPANVCEAFGRHHHRETLWFLQIARASAKETRCWLEQSSANGLIDQVTWQDLEERTTRVERMLAGLSRSLREREANRIGRD